VALHPKNKGFEWQDVAASRSCVTDEQARQYDQYGFFLFEEAFSADEIRAISDAIDPFEQERERALRQEHGGRENISRAGAITFTTHLVAQSDALRSFSRHPVVKGICHDLLGPTVRLYWDQAVYKKPGNPEEFPWHQDNGYTYLEPQHYLTCWIPLTDATVENGCPWVVPGAHRRGTLEHRSTPIGWQCMSNPVEAISVEAKAGDIVVFSSLTPHRTGPNLTNATRKAYILQYAADGAALWKDGSESVLQNDPIRQYLI